MSNNSLKENAVNTSWALAEKILRLGVSFIVTIYVARYLGPTRLGILSYALSFVTLFKFISLLGLDRILVRSLVTDFEDYRVLLGTAFMMKILGSVLLLISVIFTVQIIKIDQLEKWLILIIAFGMIFDPFRVIECFFQSKVQIRFVTISYALSLIIASIIKFFFVFFKAGLIWFAISVVIEQALIGFFLVFYYFKNHFSIFNWCLDLRTAKQLIFSSWPLLLSFMAVMLYMRIDQVMIKELIGSEGVGNYAIAAKFSELFYFIPVAVNQALFPALINSKALNKINYIKNMQNLFDMMVLTSVLIAIPITLLSGPIITILFGGQYSDAASVLSIHIWAGVFVFLGVSIGSWFLVENLQIYSFYRTLLGCIINIVLNFLFIPTWGITGAAAATLVSQFFVGYFSLLLFEKSRGNFILMTNSLNLFSLLKRISIVFGSIKKYNWVDKFKF